MPVPTPGYGSDCEAEDALWPNLQFLPEAVAAAAHTGVRICFFMCEPFYAVRQMLGERQAGFVRCEFDGCDLDGQSIAPDR